MPRHATALLRAASLPLEFYTGPAFVRLEPSHEDVPAVIMHHLPAIHLPTLIPHLAGMELVSATVRDEDVREWLRTQRGPLSGDRFPYLRVV